MVNKFRRFIFIGALTLPGLFLFGLRASAMSHAVSYQNEVVKKIMQGRKAERKPSVSDYSVREVPAAELKDIISKYPKILEEVCTQPYQPLKNTSDKADPRIRLSIDGNQDDNYATINFEHQKLKNLQFKIYLKDIERQNHVVNMSLVDGKYKIKKFFLPFKIHTTISIDPCYMKDLKYKVGKRLPTGYYFRILDTYNELTVLSNVSNNISDIDMIKNAPKLLACKKRAVMKIFKMLDMELPIDSKNI